MEEGNSCLTEPSRFSEFFGERLSDSDFGGANSQFVLLRLTWDLPMSRDFVSKTPWRHMAFWVSQIMWPSSSHCEEAGVEEVKALIPCH